MTGRGRLVRGRRGRDDDRVDGAGVGRGRHAAGQAQQGQARGERAGDDAGQAGGGSGELLAGNPGGAGAERSRFPVIRRAPGWTTARRRRYGMT
jgi:hypothetical protein